MSDYDIVIIGAGPAGERGAAQAAYFGKKVALIEKAPYPGGACTNTGTLPSKTLRETALHLSGLASRGITGVAFDLNSTVTARQLMNKKDAVVKSEHERIWKNLGRHRVDYLEGTAVFVDKNTVDIRDRSGETMRTVTSEKFLISTGSSPHRPKEVPFDDKIVWDSDSVLALKEIPRSIAIIGAGVIGSEYACIFAALGVKVFLVDGRDRLMPFLDSEISSVLMKEMERLGVVLHLKAPVKSYACGKSGVVTELEGSVKLETDTLLYAAGRNGNTRGLGLEAVGLVADKRGQLKVNENYQTEVAHIYAAGDVIGFPALASTSMDQGRLAVCHALGLQYRRRMVEHLPMGIYTIPEVSACGETEETAKAKGLDFVIGRAFFSDNARAEIMGDTGGMLKILFDRKSLAVIGVHIVCERASEILTPGLLALRQGTTIDFFIETVFNYPTLSEAYKYAAYDGLQKLHGREVR